MNTTLDITKLPDFEEYPIQTFATITKLRPETHGGIDVECVENTLRCIQQLTVPYWHYLSETSAGPAYSPEQVESAMAFVDEVPEVMQVYVRQEVTGQPTLPLWWPSFIVAKRKPQLGQTLKGIILRDSRELCELGEEHETSKVLYIEGNMVKTLSRTYHVQYSK